MSARPFWIVSMRDPPQRAFFVFHTYRPGEGGVELRPEYRRLVCPKCSWWDPRKAARIGISPEVRCPFRNRDILKSDDGRLVVSKRCRRMLERIAGVNLQFFALPGDPSYFLAFAKQRILVKSVRSWPKGKAFLKSKGTVCRHCHSHKGVRFYSEAFELDRRISLAAVILDCGSWFGFRESFMASEKVAAQLKQANLRGLWLRHVAPQAT